MVAPMKFYEGKTVMVAGGGGFIGGHLVRRLAALGGTDVRAVDVRPIEDWEQRTPGVEEVVADLSQREACEQVTRRSDLVFNLAAEMGGMGFIQSHPATCMFSVLIHANLIRAAQAAGLERYFYASSACVYNRSLQDDVDSRPLREQDAFPALPEEGYGWEKLFGERLCANVQAELGLAVRVARFHNVYGPYGAWRGGREKAAAALCRKVAEAVAAGSPSVEVWGDGRQVRTFMYVDDCVEGALRIMASGCSEPLNLGSTEEVTVDGLLSKIERIAGVRLERTHRLDAPTGVRGRRSDNTRLREVVGWSPSISLDDGLDKTYPWVAEQVGSA
jgi:GDP-D-mannose 3',5'-epimerase